MSMSLRLVIGTYLLLTSGCAVLHKVQLTDVEGNSNGRRISIKVSENTVNIREVADLVRRLGRASRSKTIGSSGNALENYTAFQFGPRTGTPVFNEFYVRDLAERLQEKCKKGRLANIVSVRESREYPVIKGEIVRIDARCLRR